MLQEIPSPQNDSKPARRRWFQFSLRTMIVATAIFCILLATWIIPSERQRRAAEKLTVFKGKYCFADEQLNINNHWECIPRTTYAASPYEPKWYHHWTNSVDQIFVPEQTNEIDFMAFPHLRKVTIGNQFQGGLAIVNRLLEQLAQIPSVREIVIFPETNDETFDLLAKFPKLESLEIDSLAESNHPLRKLRKAGNLRHLSLNSSNLSVAELADVAEFKKLQSLHLIVSEENISGISQLKDLPDLHSFSLITHSSINTGSAELACQFIGECHGLQQLTLNADIFNEDAARHLAQLKQLRKINLLSQEITYAAVQELSKLTNLKTLEIPRLDIQSPFWNGAAAMKNIESLSVSVLFSHEDLDFLNSFPNLEHLETVHLTVHSPGFNTIIQHKNLKTVKLSHMGREVVVPVERIKKYVVDHANNKSLEFNQEFLFEKK